MTVLGPARAAKDLQIAGFIVTGAGSNAIGNDNGLFAFHRNTSANHALTVRTADGSGSGWAGADHPDWSRIDFEAVSKRALDKARASRGPVAIEPGRCTVMLEPQAVGDLVRLAGGCLDARSADECRSPFAKQGGGNKIGEKIVHEKVAILSDLSDAQLLSQPFDGEGFPLDEQVRVERDVLKKLCYSRFSVKNESPLFMLNNPEMLGRPERLAGTEAGGDIVMPAIRVREFDFTSLSEAV